MSKYTIERGIKVPAALGKLDPDSFQGKLRALKVGESLFRLGSIGQIRTTAWRILGKGKYAARMMDGGVRVWRIK